ncbi:MAG: acetyl-CoA synthase subunit gamma [Deltaproteobacteria bacterium]|nr:acetyl-CoA synthase subunit gamma [Deltaproteobacteria bacterium]
MKIIPKAGQSGCCGSAQEKTACCPSEPTTSNVFKTDSVLTLKDHLAHLRCRVGAYRAKYMVKPGLYALGNPGKESDVFVTANYGLSFDKLRSALIDTDAWILVLDTKGINVWCAAGKGTFGTEELVKKIFSTQLFSVVSHRRLILPQLGAPGVAAHEVKRQTGFRVIYGPVRATDLKGFVNAGYKAAAGMRQVGFSLLDRVVLTPMEIRPALKGFSVFALIVLALFGLTPSGISFSEAADWGLPLAALGFLSIIAGAFITPTLLPWVPFRSFALKGWVTGLMMVLVFDWFAGWPSSLYLDIARYLFFPLASSYVALQFTGSTVYTGLSGVQKELRYSIPVYIGGTVLSFVLLSVFKIKTLGLL